MKPTGYLIHEGEKNGHPFAVIATLKSKNVKTGNMIQIWFLLRDINPVAGVKSGLDAKTICAECPFASGNGCYVNVGQAPLGIWKAYRKGRYPQLNPVDYSKVFSGRSVRFGAYGNPSLLPISMVRAIASISTGWTGYFHDWRTNPFASEYAKYFMASTETADSFAQASRLKLRVFHASPIQPENTLECLSETKGLECASCKLCAGLSKSRLPSIWINPHGSKVARANAQALSVNN